MRKTFIVLTTLLIMVLCNNRTDPISSRDNKWDSGGNNFLYNGVPSVYGALGTEWYDYDHETNTGSMLLTFHADDPNIPHDSLTCHIFAGNTADLITERFAENESTCVIGGLTSNMAYTCSLVVKDQWDSVCDTVLMGNTPVLIPPQAPSPSISVNEMTMTLTWITVSGATRYNIYSTDKIGTPFQRASSVPQPDAGAGASVVAPFTFNKPASRFFIVSSVNQAGESRSEDTLFGAIHSDAVAVPVIDSVSKGTFVDRIAVYWHSQERDVASFGIYRSRSENDGYRLIGMVEAKESPYIFYDTVTTSEPYYYRLSAFNSDNISGELSEPVSGYTVRDIERFNLTIENFSDHVALFWNPVQYAVSYTVYRTSFDSDALNELSTTEDLFFNDSTATSVLRFYMVAAFDASGREVGRSDRKGGALGMLKAPEGVQISIDKPSNRIIMKWNLLPGAVHYYVFRSEEQCTYSDKYKQVTENLFINTDIGSSTYYYAVAGVDNSGRIGDMSLSYKAGLSWLPSPTGLQASDGKNDTLIFLKWDALSGAAGYKVYRSATSCYKDMQLIASSPETSYADKVPSTAIYYYTVAGVDENGSEGSPSACDNGRVKLLSAPEGLSSSGTAKGITISWSKVAGALGYIVYRGTSGSFGTSMVIDTVNTTSLFDATTSTATFYYWVAALGPIGQGEISKYTYCSTLSRPSITVSRYSTHVRLNWSNTTPWSIAVIYRGLDSLNLTQLNTTKENTYDDYTATYDGLYYQVRLLLSTSDTVSSVAVLGYRLLPPPATISALDTKNGPQIRWSSVSGALSYIIYRSERSTDPLQHHELTDTTYLDKISTTTRYYYRVAARNRVQTSIMSNFVTGGLIQTPLTPLQLTATGTSDAIILTWFVSSSGSTPEGFIIHHSRSTAGPFTIDTTSMTRFVDSVTDTGWYYYRVAAYNGNGTSPTSNFVSARLRAPEPPSIESVSKSLYSKYVKIVWYRKENATEYAIYRGSEKIAVTTDTFYLDTSALTNTMYYYSVASIHKGNEGRRGTSNNGARLGPPSVVYAYGDYNGISVYWESDIFTVEKYYIYRSLIPSDGFVLIDSTLSLCYYFDTSDVPGYNYYRIAARNLETSEMSVVSEATRRYFPKAPYDLTASQGTYPHTVRVCWAPAAGANGYRIYRSSTSDFESITTVHGTSSDTCLVDSVFSDSFYYYKVKSFNKIGESSPSYETASGFRTPTTLPLTPSNLDTLDYGYGSAIVLTWDWGQATIGYEGIYIYRAESESGTYTLVGTKINTSENTYWDEPPLSSPTVYWYKIKAYNAAGESEFSNTVSGTRK